MTRVRTDAEWELLAREGRADLPRALREMDAVEDADVTALEVRADHFGLSDGVSQLRWNDMQGAVDEAGGLTALTTEGFRDTGVEMRFFRNNQADELHFKFQMSHAYVPGTAVKFHMHVIPMANGSGTIAFAYKYFVAKVGTTIPALSGWSTATQTRAVTPANQYQHTIIPSISISMVDMEESALVLVSVRRDETPDTYDTSKDHGTGAANVAIVSADLHYQVEKSGTVNEFPGAP